MNSTFPLVLVSAIAGTSITGGRWVYVAFCGLAVAILLQLLIFARIAAFLQNQSAPKVAVTIRDHWRNYFLVSVLLALPMWIYLVIRPYIGSAGSSLWLREGLTAAIQALTIYVLPIVFLKRVGLVAIPAGIYYLARSLGASSWIIAIVLIASIADSARYLALGLLEFPLVLVPILMLGVFATYLYFVAFAAATSALARNKTGSPSVA